MPKEDMTADTARPAGAQVDCDSFTDIGRHRQLCPAAALAPNGESAVVPIDVIQTQRHDRSDQGPVELCQQAGTSARWKGTKPLPAAHIRPSRRKSLPDTANSGGKIEERSPAIWPVRDSTDG